MQKYFQNEHYLEAHMKRRHPKYAASNELKGDSSSNEVINNLINALTQTALNRPEKDDVYLKFK